MIKIRLMYIKGDITQSVSNALAKKVFLKVCGRTKEALPKALKAKAGSLAKFKGLWKAGTLSYTAFAREKNDMVLMKDFTSKFDTIIFLAPLRV